MPEVLTEKPSPFAFDVWQCPTCGWAMSDNVYKQLTVNVKCPNCEEDELYSFLMLGWTKSEPPSVQDCIDSGMKCYRCGWESLGRNIFGGKCLKCGLFFSRPTGEKNYVYCCGCRLLIAEEAERERIHAEVEAMDWPEVIG